MIESYFCVLPQLWHSKALWIMSDFSHLYKVTKCRLATKIILGKHENMKLTSRMDFSSEQKSWIKLFT